MAEEAATGFTNQDDYALMCEFVRELLRSNPYMRYDAHGVGIGRIS